MYRNQVQPDKERRAAIKSHEARSSIGKVQRFDSSILISGIPDPGPRKELPQLVFQMPVSTVFTELWALYYHIGETGHKYDIPTNRKPHSRLKPAQEELEKQSK